MIGFDLKADIRRVYTSLPLLARPGLMDVTFQTSEKGLKADIIGIRNPGAGAG